MSKSLTSKPPSFFWTLAECRAIFELNSFYLSRPFKRFLPQGDGHPVLVLPGFMATDFSTRPLRKLLNDIGYQAHPWRLGRNMVFHAEREAEMGRLIKSIYEESGKQKISLVGWSLGGTFARELAKTFPKYVRCVISLGSPINGDRQSSNARHLFDAINGEPTPTETKRYSTLRELPTVPCTSIYSKTDGIVAWQASLQEESPISENIRVPASHLGLGVNPLVMYAIADRLAQNPKKWQAFDIKGARKLFFRKP